MSKKKYKCPTTIRYHSKRYNKNVIVQKGYESDCATGGSDIYSDAWWVHDVLCDTGVFADGSPCTNWQASQIISDILKAEGRWFRRFTWKWGTFLFGGGKARKNGMLKLRKK